MGRSTFMTGTAIATSMIGSSMVLLPVTFSQHGILICSIFCFLMAAILGLTCKLLVDQLKPDEKDISQSIRRKLGPIFGNSFALTSSILMVLVSSVFFLLAADLFCDVLYEFFGEMNVSRKMIKLILLVLFGSLNYLRDLSLFFKAAPVAMGALVVSTAILIISIPFNTDNISTDFFAMKPITAKTLLTVISVNGYSYECHLSVSPIVKENKNQKDNSKAVYLGFSISFVLYLIVGLLGALAIEGKVPSIQKSEYNTMDYFSGEWQAPIIGILNFIYLFIVSPIFPYVGKNQALELIPKKTKEGISHLWMKASVLFSLVWFSWNILLIVAEISTVVVIGLITAVVNVYCLYFLPIWMTFKAKDYVFAQEGRDETSIESGQKEQDFALELGKKSEDGYSLTDTAVSESEEKSELTQAFLSEEKVVKLSLGQKILYLSVMGFGLSMLTLELVSFFI